MAEDRPNMNPTGDDAAPSPEDMVEEALESAREAIDAMQDEADAVNAHSMELPRFDRSSASPEEAAISLLADVNLHVKIELGRTRMYVEDVLRLNEGAVVELDKPAGDPVDVFVNNRHVARGEVLVVNDNFCVRISEIIDTPSIED